MNAASAPVEGPAKFLLEGERARVAVRLKHDEHTFPAAGSGGRYRRCDLSGMMPIVIDHQIALGFVADFKSTSCAAEAFERGGDLVEGKSDFEGQGDHGKGIDGVV